MSNTRPKFQDSTVWQKAVPASVAVAYAVFSTAWIVLSDRVAASVAQDAEQLHRIQTYKGELFVLVSSVLIFYLLRAAWSRLVSAYERARTSERRLELALSAAGAGVWETGIDGDEASSAFMSTGLMARLGFPPTRTITLGELSALRHPDDVVASDRAFADVLTGAAEHLDVRYRIRASDGSYRWINSRGKVAQGRDGKPRLIGVSLDINEQMAAEQTVDHMTRFDSVTGLAKPPEFINAIDAILEASPGAVLAAAQFRLSNLSQHLDEAGIAGSGTAVRTVSDRLHRLAETGIIAARLSTDTFAVATPALGSQDAARAMIDRVSNLFTLPLDKEGQRSRLLVSIGASLLPSGGTAADMLRLSGHALELADPHEAAVMWFTSGMEESVNRRNHLARALGSAVARGQIEAHFQPLVQLETGRVAGFEALARWRLEDELVPPDQFIPMAERFGHIGEIGEAVLRQACSAMAAMSADLRGPFVAVNVSPIQLQNPAFPALVARILAETGLQPVRLELEITETALARDIETSARRLQRLRTLGVSIAIDDFGTGYSSLSMLRALPFNRLKVDRAFIKDYGIDGETTTIADTIIDMCRDLKLEITAEGIEDLAIAAKLRDRGVEIGQGYCFSRPVAHPGELLDRVWAIMPLSRLNSTSVTDIPEVSPVVPGSGYFVR